jgi:nucleoside-diphosphate-sugar epimerase
VLAPRLLEQGFEVVGLDSGLYDDCLYAETGLSVPTIRRDVRDVTYTDLDGVAVVVHLAGFSNSASDEFSARTSYAVNYLGAMQLAGLSKFAGVRRFIYLSAFDGAAVESGLGYSDPECELGQLDPAGWNNVISRWVEQDMLRLADPTFCPTFLRCSTLYGYSPRLRLDLPLNYMVARGVSSGQVYIRGAGDGVRVGLHVDDMASAIVAAIKAPQTSVARQVFDLNDLGGLIPAEALADIFRLTMPDVSVVYEAPASRQQADSPQWDGQRTIPNFVPRWRVEQGIEQLAEAFNLYGLHETDVMSNRYHRFAHLRWLRDNHRIDLSLRWLHDHALTASAKHRRVS